jgi:hypothetical protein
MPMASPFPWICADGSIGRKAIDAAICAHENQMLKHYPLLHCRGFFVDRIRQCCSFKLPLVLFRRMPKDDTTPATKKDLRELEKRVETSLQQS